jgi:glycosyltransferase involved in cell wall biosynthesis
MAKIGIDIRNIGKQRTGDETVFFNLVKNLATIDVKNEYLLFTDITDTTVLQYIGVRLGIKDRNNFKIVSLKSPNKFCWNMRILPWYLHKNPVDVYHTQYITPFFVSKKIKIITHIHDVSFLAYPEFIKRSDLFFLELLIPRSLKRADKIIAVSEFTKQEIVKYYKINPEKIRVVYNAVSEDFLKSDYSGNELFEIRKKYNLPEEFILCIGTLQPRKNIPMLIQAFAKVKEKIPEIKLVLVGNRNAHNIDDRIDKEIEKRNLSDSVIFPGFVDEEDKSALFQLAKAFIFPSLYEGFGIPILEAMSQKIPVLASDIPVHREIAKDAGLYFNPESVDETSEKLYNILADENLRGDLINLGNKRLDFFSWKKSAENILRIYQKING